MCPKWSVGAAPSLYIQDAFIFLPVLDIEPDPLEAGRVARSWLRLNLKFKVREFIDKQVAEISVLVERGFEICLLS